MVDIGVSIPHARVEGVRGIVLAIAVSPDGVYQVAAGAPISIVALVLSSPTLTGEHLNYLASISMLLQSEQTRQRLRDAHDPTEVLRLVHEHERRAARV
jgi:PTS system nitrogen regulatory IIA component